MPFPLPFVPTLSYKTGGRRFGAPRDGGQRKHAACDLIAPHGTEIFAIEDGVVIEPPTLFYRGTMQVVVRHSSGVVRYCECERENVAGVIVGAAVTAGQIIAHVGKMYTDSMLHFELYRGGAAGPLTVRGNKGFQRRSDLIDPASLLDALAATMPVTGAAASR